MVPKILLRETGTFSEFLLQTWDIWGEKGTHFKNQISHRLAAAYTYASALRPLRKRLFANMHSLYFDQH